MCGYSDTFSTILNCYITQTSGNSVFKFWQEVAKISLCGDPKPFCDTCRGFWEIQIPRVSRGRHSNRRPMWFEPLVLTGITSEGTRGRVATRLLLVRRRLQPDHQAQDGNDSRLPLEGQIHNHAFTYNWTLHKWMFRGLTNIKSQMVWQMLNNGLTNVKWVDKCQLLWIPHQKNPLTEPCQDQMDKKFIWTLSLDEMGVRLVAKIKHFHQSGLLKFKYTQYGL